MFARPRRSLGIGVAVSMLAAGLAVTAVPASAFSPSVELNATGGTDASNGLRIKYGSGQIQVVRNGVDQMHATGSFPGSTTASTLLNGIYLRVGNTLVGPRHAGVSGGTLTPVEWTSITATNSGSTQILSTLTYTTGSLTYQINVTLDYLAATDQYFTENLVVQFPVGNVDVVKVYRTIDTQLDGSDTGAGFYDVTDSTRPTVGVRSADLTHVLAFRKTSGPAWTGYWSGQSSCMYSDTCTATTGLGYLNRGTDFPASAASVDSNAATNNGIGIEWDLALADGGALHTIPTGTEYTFQHEVVVGELLPTVTTFDQPADAVLSDGFIELSMAGVNGGYVEYSSSTEEVCTVDGPDVTTITPSDVPVATVTFLAEGTCTLTANQAASGGHTAADPVTRSLLVMATPTPTPTPTPTLPVEKPLPKIDRSRWVKIPSDPNSVHGKEKKTKAFNASFSGIDAYPIRKLGSRELVKGEAASLSPRGFFRFDSAKLTKKGRAEAKAMVNNLEAAKTIRCEGYADYAGNRNHELDLSLHRAKAFCKALKKYGADVVTKTRGYGPERPAVVGGTARGRKENRRVVIVIRK